MQDRVQEALRLKAARGELHTTVAIGYRRGADDRLEQDPDLRVCEALSVAWSLPRYNTVHRLLTKSGLCRRLCFRAHRLPGSVRGWAQRDHPRRGAPAGPMRSAYLRPP